MRFGRELRISDVTAAASTEDGMRKMAEHVIYLQRELEKTLSQLEKALKEKG